MAPDYVGWYATMLPYILTIPHEVLVVVAQGLQGLDPRAQAQAQEDPQGGLQIWVPPQ